MQKRNWEERCMLDSIKTKGNWQTKLLKLSIIRIVTEIAFSGMDLVVPEKPKPIRYYHILQGEGVHVIMVAWTGIAANLLPSGTTVHTRFKLPITVTEGSQLQFAGQSKEAQVLRNTQVIIWDEAPMATRQALEMINRGLQDVTQSTDIFGGKILLMGGDFRQVLPVVQHGSRAAQISCCIKRSDLWPHFQVRHLTKNLRVNTDEIVFAKFLLELGDGRLPHEDDNIDVPAECITDDVIADIFGALIQNNAEDPLLDKIILCPTNEETFTLNDQILDRLEGSSRTYTSIDQFGCENGEDPTEFSPEFLYTLTPNGLPPHNLRLKKGAVVILLRNLNVKRGLCNGTRLIVQKMHHHLLQCTLMSGDFCGTTALLPRIKLEPTEAFLPVQFTRLQFPIRLAFAMTFNKAQGQTFRKIGLFLLRPVFSHGQLPRYMSDFLELARCHQFVCSYHQGKRKPKT